MPALTTTLMPNRRRQLRSRRRASSAPPPALAAARSRADATSQVRCRIPIKRAKFHVVSWGRFWCQISTVSSASASAAPAGAPPGQCTPVAGARVPTVPRSDSLAVCLRAACLVRRVSPRIETPSCMRPAARIDKRTWESAVSVHRSICAQHFPLSWRYQHRVGSLHTVQQPGIVRR